MKIVWSEDAWDQCEHRQTADRKICADQPLDADANSLLVAASRLHYSDR